MSDNEYRNGELVLKGESRTEWIIELDDTLMTDYSEDI